MLDRNAPTPRRLIVARVLLLGVAIAAAYTASTEPADILAMVSWAFSLAAAGIFPALVLGIWWKRANTWGCTAGMIIGFGLCLAYLVVSRYCPVFGVQYMGMRVLSNLADPAQVAAAFPAAAAHPLASKVGVNNISSALFSLPVRFVIIWIVSLMTPAPSRSVQEMVENTRRPKGEMILKDKDAAKVTA
jgi:cation/acetate symporter